MKELRVSEVFVSPQGEGPRTGYLTQFVRFAGCNMRCPLWPCDTVYAIDPAIYMHDTPEWGPAAYKRSPRALFEDCWDNVKTTGARVINLTGGEPFMQDNTLLEEFVDQFDGTFIIECFSNGSFLYPPWALKQINFVMDWKLGGSGEAETAVGTRKANACALQPKDAIKFVACNQDDLEEAMIIWRQLRDIGCQFWSGPAWGRMEASEIVDFIKKHRLPWRLNVQVHNYVYEPQERGR